MLGLQSPLLSLVPGVSHRFFQRIGGTSPHPWNALNTSFAVRDAPARVEENLARVRFQLGVKKDALFTCQQVHGTDLVVLHANAVESEVRAQPADGLVSDVAELGVGVRTADCAPILLALDDGSAVAALHAGWRGAVAGIVQRGVDALCAQRGASTARVVAAVGPCIGPRAFEVGSEVVDAAARAAPVDGLVQTGHGDRVHFDLAAFVLRLLRAAGVERCEHVGGCTFEEEAAYFSHRRDVTVRKGSETGRQLSAIARTTPPAIDPETFG